jgi:hypothetical protein
MGKFRETSEMGFGEVGKVGEKNGWPQMNTDEHG